MAAFDYDVLIVGSGFGGSVAALRAAEKGYRVAVMESGRRWADEDIPTYYLVDVKRRVSVAVGGPATAALVTYEVQEVDGAVQLRA
jgi:choline dehydrogenase-like flavoprotein